jgi:hypothetical protein
METPPIHAVPSSAARALPFAGAARVVSMLSLCAACYHAGRWTRGLEFRAESAPASAAVAPTQASVSLAAEVSENPAAGGPAGETGDTITPLNVRDPSALVMPPAGITYDSPRIVPGAPNLLPPPAAPDFPPARLLPRKRIEAKPDLRS